MSKSLAVLAEVIRDALEPGKTGEDKYDLRLIQQLVLSVAGTYRDQNLKRDLETGMQPDEGWFSREYATLKYDNRAKCSYCDVPAIAEMDHNKSLRVLPSDGSENPFVQFPAGMGFNRKDLLFAEGNIVWIYQRQRIEFPTLEKGTIEEVELSLIRADISEEHMETTRIPDKYDKFVIEDVLRLLGQRRTEDASTDGRAQ